MGKIILEFDSIEEQIEIQDALNGTNWRMAIWDLDQELRSTTKYGTPILSCEGVASETEIEVANVIRERLREILNNYNLKLDI